MIKGLFAIVMAVAAVVTAIAVCIDHGTVQTHVLACALGVGFVFYLMGTGQERFAPSNEGGFDQASGIMWGVAAFLITGGATNIYYTGNHQLGALAIVLGALFVGIRLIRGLYLKGKQRH